MDQRVKKYLLLFLDLFYVALLFVTIGVLVSDTLKNVQPFQVIYTYLQYLALYMTFRLKHCTSRIDINVIYRFHLFNFLFSLFTVVTGYLELVKSINGEGFFKNNPGFFAFHLISLISAHICISVYICCPQFSLNDRLIVERGGRRNGGQQEALLMGDPRTHFLSFEQLQLKNEKYDPSENQNDNTCSICLDDFQTGQVIKSLPYCKHFFHEDCLKTWYETAQQDTCPVCRRRFSTAVDQEENSQNQQQQNLRQDNQSDDSGIAQEQVNQDSTSEEDNEQQNHNQDLEGSSRQSSRRSIVARSSRGQHIIIPQSYNRFAINS